MLRLRSFHVSYGNDIFNVSRMETEGMYDGKNQSTEVLKRWRIQMCIRDRSHSVDFDAFLFESLYPFYEIVAIRSVIFGVQVSAGP